MKDTFFKKLIKFLCLLLLALNVFSGGNESDSLLMESLDEVLIEEYKPCSDQSDISSLEVNTISSLMIVSENSLFTEGEVITSASGVQAIVDSHDVKTQKLTYHQDAHTGFETFLLNEKITGSSSGIAIVKEFIIDLTIPCSELIVSIEEEPQQMIFTPKKSAEEAKATAELAAQEMMAEILAEEELAKRLAEFQAKVEADKAAAARSTAIYQARQQQEQMIKDRQAQLALERELSSFESQLAEDLANQAALAAFQQKLAEEKAAAAASTAAYQSQLEYDAQVAELMDALQRELEIEAFEAQLKAELAAQEMMAEILAEEELAKRLAEFQAKVEAEKAAAARSTEIYQARQQQEQMIKDRQAQLALARELDEFEAKLEKELAFDEWYANYLENKAAEEALEKELDAFEAQLAAELAAARNDGRNFRRRGAR